MLPQSSLWSRVLLAVLAVAVALQPDVVLADKAGDDFNLGVGLWRKELWTPAVDTFEQFLKDYPDHPRVGLATFYLGLSYSSLQKYEMSRDRFEDFLRLNSDSSNAAVARYRIGECSYYLHEYEQAVAQLEVYVLEHPDDKLVDWGNLQLGESLVQVKRWAEADVILKKLLTTASTDYVKGQAQYSLALSLEKQGNADAAVDAYRKVAQQDDERQATRALARAGTILFRHEQYDLAAALYDQIVARFPKSRLTPSAALNSGLAFYRVQKYEDAIRRFNDVAQESTEKTEATLLTGMSFARLQRFDEARSTLRTAFDAAGKTELAAEALYEMARLEQIAGKLDVAVQMYVDLVDRWPKDSHTADSMFNAASLQLELNNTESAAQLLDRMKTEFPADFANPRATFLIGRILLRQSNPTAAREALSQVVDAEDAAPRSVALSLYYLARIDHDRKQFGAALQTVLRLRPALNEAANSDLQGALALGAMSALELSEFTTAEELATAYLEFGQDAAQSADARAARTVARASAGNYKAALEDADKLVASAADNPQTWTAILQSAEHAWDQEEYPSALELFRRTDNERAPSATRQSGSSGVAWCLFHQKQFKEAAEAFGQTAGSWPETSAGLEARYMQVRSLQEDGQADTAVTEYAALAGDFVARAAKTDDQSLKERLQSYALDAGRTAARLLDSSERRDEANQQWASLADHFSDSKELDSVLDEWAWSNLKSQQYEKADDVYRRLLKERPESQFAGTARLSLAESDLNAQRMDQALREFQAIVEHPQYGESEKAKSLFHLIDISTERQTWKRVIELANQFATNYSAASLAPRVQLLHADALVALQQSTKASELLEMLRRSILDRQLEAAPWTERIWIVLGEAALAAKDYTEIDLVAEQFAEQFPEAKIGFQMKYLLGRRWKNQPEPEFAKAREYFESVIYDETGRGTHTAARCQFLIADTWLMQKDYAQASRDYFKVYTLYRFPELQAQALYQAGTCQRESGELNEAIQTWKSLLKEFPDSPVVADATQQLKAAAADR
jgi:TolA-binding protein